MRTHTYVPDVELPLTKAEAEYLHALLDTEASESEVPHFRDMAKWLANRLARRIP